jgi:hypothetical protein
VTRERRAEMGTAQCDDAADRAFGAELTGHQPAVAVADEHHVRGSAGGERVEVVRLGVVRHVPGQFRKRLGDLQARFQPGGRISPGAGAAVEAVQEHREPILGGGRAGQCGQDRDEHQRARHG